MAQDDSHHVMRAAAERALRERERQVVTALEQSNDAIVLFDSDDRVVFGNNAWRELNSVVEWTCRPGITFEQHIRALADGGFIPEAVGREEEWIAARLEHHRNPRGPLEVSRQHGRWISINEQVLDDGSTIVIITDITERKNAEKIIRTQNERFNVALENIPFGICVYDKDHRLVVSNENFARMYGVAPEHLTPGLPMKAVLEQRIALGIYAGDSPEQYLEDRLKWVARKTPGVKTDTLSDGRTIQITQRPLEGGGWLSVHNDVTERVRTQSALQKTERQFRDLVEGSIQGLFIAREWTLLFANQALANIFGYSSPEELLAVGSVFELIDPCEHSRLKHYKIARDNGDRAPETYECAGLKKDGSSIILEFRVKQVEWEGNVAKQCVVVDITDRKRAEKELIQHRDRLQQLVSAATRELKVKAGALKEALAKEKRLNEQQRHFISVASHEFRTPLSIIDGTVQRLLRNRDNITPEELVKRATKIRAGIKTMTNLMESTLAAARIDAGKAELHIADCDLRGIVLDVCTRQLELDDSHAISCDLKLLPDSVKADRTALEQIFTNLLSNAVKYSPGSPEITVRGWLEGNGAFVSVRDRGLGIGAAEIPKLFSRFFRASTSTGIPGTGIGLNLVKKLVELHSGSIRVESTRGQGATFTVQIPISGPSQFGQTESTAA